ncbi:hypothetical protein ACH4XT_29460 [Streptomyces avidinii]|uniref:hypothetical protein n=1 Tax=Streptomyces avidinii TaxID=1895 RepID=UPI00378B041F
MATASADKPSSRSVPAVSRLTRAAIRSRTPAARSAAHGSAVAVAVSCPAISAKSAGSGTDDGQVRGPVRERSRQVHVRFV